MRWENWMMREEQTVYLACPREMGRERYKKSLQQLVIVAKAGRLNTRLGLE